LPAPERPVTTEVVVEAEAAVAVIVEASEADSAGSAAEAVADLEAEAPEEVGVDPEAEDPWEAVEVRGRSTGAEAEETEAWEETDGHLVKKENSASSTIPFAESSRNKGNPPFLGQNCQQIILKKVCNLIFIVTMR